MRRSATRLSHPPDSLCRGNSCNVAGQTRDNLMIDKEGANHPNPEHDTIAQRPDQIGAGAPPPAAAGGASGQGQPNARRPAAGRNEAARSCASRTGRGRHAGVNREPALHHARNRFHARHRRLAAGSTRRTASIARAAPGRARTSIGTSSSFARTESKP